MPSNLKTLAQFRAQINKLQTENQQLRLLLRIIIDTAHHAVNGSENEEEEKEVDHE